MEKAVTGFLYLLISPFAVALVVGAMLWRGYVLAILWGWFAVPQFGVQSLSVAAAMGLSLLVGFLTSNRIGNETRDDSKRWEPILRLAYVPAITLAFGWMVKNYA